MADTPGTLPSRIAVFRALMLGDMLCAIPAVRAIRHAMPKAEITLIGLPWAREFAARFDRYFDAFLEFPGLPGLPEISPDVAAFPGFVAEAQRRDFDLVLQMHGSGRLTNPLVLLLGARRAAGFYRAGEYCPDPGAFFMYPDDESEVWRNLGLIRSLGIPLQGDSLEWPVTHEDRVALRELCGGTELETRPYVCLHPGARYPSRRWKAEGFARVGDYLAGLGYRVVITGSSSESELTGSVRSMMTAPATNLAGRTSLGALAALLEGARLLVCNDTGVSHLAAALGVPSVVIILGSDPRRWAPLDARLHRTVMHPLGCRPCDHVVCPLGAGCADTVRVEDVVAEIAGLLPDSDAAAASFRQHFPHGAADIPERSLLDRIG